MSDPFLSRLEAILGPRGLIAEPSDMAPYLKEERGLFFGQARAVARPASTEEVAAVVRLCATEGVAIVPQAGNTSLVGGGVPDEQGRQLIVNVGRMNRVRSVDATNFTMTVEAGVILEAAQKAADEIGCLFPLSMGSEGSCEIGGNLSSNAGGLAVLHYGNARELVLGLEVVLPDGRVWDGLRALRKDNTGYDLKQLFIGAEGTLGIITAAVLKLFPKPRSTETALVALTDLDSALALLTRARAASGDQVTAFELLPRMGVGITLANIPGVVDPFPRPHDWYALVELSTSRPDADLGVTLEGLLHAAIEAGEAADAVIAASLDQRLGLWRLREGLPPAEKICGGGIKHDVSVPVSSVPRFIRAASAAVVEAMPGVRVLAFGHVGDGNIHFNLMQPDGMAREDFFGAWFRMNRIVHDIVVAMGGSISAEHGIGRLKRDELARYKAPVEIELMHRIKAALDPDNLMNPGKIL